MSGVTLTINIPFCKIVENEMRHSLVANKFVSDNEQNENVRVQTAEFARGALDNWKAIKIPRIKVERVHC